MRDGGPDDRRRASQPARQQDQLRHVTPWRQRGDKQAGAGDVLVSGTVRDLVAGSGLAFEDRGTVSLKGVPGEWRLFAVAG